MLKNDAGIPADAEPLAEATAGAVSSELTNKERPQVTDPSDPFGDAPTTGEGEMMTKTKAAKTKVKAKAKAKKARRSAKTTRVSKVKVPDHGQMKLAADGIQAHGARYIQIKFSNGSEVRLLPVNLSGSERTRIRNALVIWLARKTKR